MAGPVTPLSAEQEQLLARYDETLAIEGKRKLAKEVLAKTESVSITTIDRSLRKRMALDREAEAAATRERSSAEASVRHTAVRANLRRGSKK